MKEASKPPNSSSSCTVGDLRVIVGLVRTRRTKAFLYGLALAFVAFTAYMAFCPSNNASPWFNNLFASASVSTAPYRSQISSIFTYIFPNSSAPSPSPRNPTPLPQNLPADGGGDRKGGILAGNLTSVGGAAPERGGSSAAMNQTATGIGLLGSGVAEKNSSVNGAGFKGIGDSKSNQTTMGGEEDSKAKDGAAATKATVLASKNQTASGEALKNKKASSVDLSKGTDLPTKKQVNMTAAASPHKIQSFNAADSAKNRDDEMDSKEAQAPTSSEITAETNQSSGGVSSITKISASTPAKTDKKGASASSDSLLFGNGSAGPPSGDVQGSEQVDWVSAMEGCDIFQGRWVKDDSYPLYPEGSCPHIDEPFDCYRNGRTDRAYQKLRWQPNGCNIPRLNATDMLERLRGKRLVFVGDSLNRNMWESLVCILRNSINDKSKVFEASGRHEFRTEGSYSFVFKDFNCSVEYFRSPFLVEEGEMPESNGKEKETLRLDTIEKASARYKDADVVIFNTGHWWTHEKTSKGKDYYQEGNHIYSELNVVEAFHIALNTWAKWVDANVNPSKSLVFFRGYSASHFKGGQWNSGGQCDKETEPIKEEKYLSSYPWKMSVLESVIKGMKSPVSYMNITRMTDYRKDAHPSIYRKQNLTEEERRAPERFQDCSHWCLPGVPDSWNELLYAQLISKQHRMVQERANQH